MSGLEFSVKGLEEQERRLRDDRRGRLAMTAAVVASLFVLAGRGPTATAPPPFVVPVPAVAPPPPPPPAGAAALAVNPARIDFGTQRVDAAAQARTVMLTNTGTKDFIADYAADLGDPAFSVVGCHARAYERDAGSRTCQLSVSFRPAAAGTHEARVVVFETSAAGKAVGSALATIVLVGRGDAPPAPPPPSPARLEVTPSRLDFGSAAAEQNVALGNAGGEPLSITAVRLAGADAGRFRVDSGTCTAGPIEAGGQCSITVRHRVVVLAKANTAEIVIEHTAADSPARIPVRWTAPPPARVEARPASLDFGTVRLGARASLTATIVNVGSVDAGSAFTVMTGDRDAFQVGANGCNGTLAPQQQCTVEVVFAPSKAQAAEATLLVAGASLSLSGVGQAPAGPPVPPAAIQVVPPQTTGPVIN